MVVQAHSPTGVETDGSCHVVCAHVSLLCSVDGLLWTLTAPHRVLVRGEAGVRPQRDRRGRRCTDGGDRKSTRLNSSHVSISYAVFCLKQKTTRRSRDA